ncbi:HNH endonuclease signature motif containing protein [Streptomyces europaeiscabiei]|uniref:HNH endonuclease signature motif containing protein n=1 Tax=Streptomyces europaeiscabiei TaxID=146819 RepID=UPI0029AB28A0|nr:HNH endonuclease signature motif containing protein [Streptomyces europaeiscabiei]MDX2527993.1 HNH endonuclease signature motif containing protein [Streptomyces europaeiscabiei]MDX3549552.1 HNH endonuclease signature motif containing protein [Streptomyces europaeiscabiei]
MPRLAQAQQSETEAAALAAIEEPNVVARFWARVERGDGCWLWTGGKSGNYGQLTHHRRRLLAHRFSWYLDNRRPCPEGMVIRHRCDTPPCVRPDHLELGSVAQNVRDSYDRGRRVGNTKTRGTARPNAVLDDELVADLRRQARAGRSIRSLAASLDIAYTTAYRAIRGTGWPHVSEPPLPRSRKGRPNNKHFVRQNPEVANRAQALRDKGLSLDQVADQLGITKTAAFRCCRTQSKETTS